MNEYYDDLNTFDEDPTVNGENEDKELNDINNSL